MTYSEKFSLKWNDFLENISSAFSNLREETDFTDVTLLTEDGKTFEVHRAILAAFSPFFRNIFRIKKQPNPLIYMKGFKEKDLNSILDFMYYGSADVYQTNLDDFLARAEELQLQGLTGERDEEKEKDSTLKSLQTNDITEIRSMPAMTESFTDNFDKQEHVTKQTNA